MKLVNVHTALTTKQKKYIVAEAKKHKLPQAVIMRSLVEKAMKRATTTK